MPMLNIEEGRKTAILKTISKTGIPRFIMCLPRHGASLSPCSYQVWYKVLQVKIHHAKENLYATRHL